MKRCLLLLLVIASAPVFALSNASDPFVNLANTLQEWLGGGLGTSILTLAVFGIIIALVGFAPMKVLYMGAIVAIVIKYGPEVGASIAGTSAETTKSFIMDATNHFWDILIALVLGGAVVNLGVKNYRLQKRLDSLEVSKKEA